LIILGSRLLVLASQRFCSIGLDWLVGWLVGWMDGWLVGWLATSILYKK